MKNYTHRNTCRLCDAEDLELVLPILPSPIGDAFVPESRLAEEQQMFPLDTYLCLACGHLQNLDIVNPDILFRDYTYKTSASLGLVEHFKNYAKSVITDLAIKPGSLVVEIGSNDGSLLKAFKSNGMRVVGVDPAVAIAEVATSEGVPTIPDFFTPEIAQQLLEKNGPASLFCANNVFAHADNIRDIVKGIRALLSSDGVFVFEVSYVPDMVDKLVFDTIYHEHVSHHALIPLEKFFNILDMTLFSVQRVPTKGGSIRAFAQPLSTGKRPKENLMVEMFKDESLRGFEKPQIYRKFYEDIDSRKQETLSYIKNAISEGKTVAAYGASTTTTTLLYHFELESCIKYIFDDNPVKFSTYSPGAHIPVLNSDEIYTLKPDVILILAWQYADLIIKRHIEYLSKGGSFLIPLPEMKVIKR
ncbi:MAG: class I SAM-dependent methyltransferase [Polynucleobacter sp.]|nr:class I SAM-dependent methyltransferase [Polynucleobacter sp.]